MTRQTAIRTDLRVSLQHRRAPDRVTGHIEAGFLLDESIVMVPMVSPVLLDRNWDPEILIFPNPPRIDMKIERFTADKLISYALDDRSDRPVNLVILLDGQTRYAPQVTELHGARIIEQLGRTDGDIWAAALAAGVVDPQLRDISPELLVEVNRVEVDQLRPVRLAYTYPTYAELIKGECQLPFCLTQERP
jgi:hypothetical protein